MAPDPPPRKKEKKKTWLTGNFSHEKPFNHHQELAQFSQSHMWFSLKAHTFDSMKDRFGLAEGR